MVKIINADYDSFMQSISGKSLFLYGAGKRTKTIYNYFCLHGKVKAIIDRNVNIKKFEGNNEEIPVITLEEFLINETVDNSILLIVPTYVYMEIIEELDAQDKLNGLQCYIASLIQDCYKQQDFEFTRGVLRIPKKIHYCWFGGGEIPDRLKRYMESWYRFCPDYEIIRWDESNYDITINQYMKEAYENKKWGYVPDYARLDIVYNEGGIYLDTDVELLAPIDRLLNDEMFCHFSCEYEVNCGSGFGAVKGHKLIKRMRDYYDDKLFCNEDGTLNVTACMEYQNPVLEEYGFRLNNTYQNINGVVLYPSEVANPTGRIGVVNHTTSKTLMCHHAASSHRTAQERQIFEDGMKKMRRRID